MWQLTISDFHDRLINTMHYKTEHEALDNLRKFDLNKFQVTLEHLDDFNSEIFCNKPSNL